MRLLIWASLAYAAVLVVALAVSLVLILVALMRVRAALVPVAAALRDAAERTAPLEDVVRSLMDAVTHLHGDVRSSAGALVRAGGVIGVEPPQSPPVQAGAVTRWQEAG